MTAHDLLLVDLDDVLAGPLTPFRGGLVARDASTVPDNGVEIGALLDDAHIARILTWYDRRLEARVDRRPALSIWLGWHLQAVLPALLAANALLGRSPRLDMATLAFVLSPDHKAVALAISEVETVPETRDPSRFAPLVRHYLAPLIVHVACRTGLTQRVLWSNAGHVFEIAVGKLEATGPRPGLGSKGLAAARALLAMPAWPDGAANPLHAPVRWVDGRRLRRVCCMRYLFPDGRICSACPMRLNNPARATVHA